MSNDYYKPAAVLGFRYGSFKMFGIGVENVTNPPHHNIENVSVLRKVNISMYERILNKDICTELIAFALYRGSVGAKQIRRFLVF